MLNPTQVKVVTFDAGGTLIDPFPSVGEVYEAVARQWNCPCPPARELNAAFLKAWKGKVSFDYSLSAWASLVDEVFGIAVPGEIFQSIYERFKERDAWMIYRDVQPVLESLRQRGYRMAVISNWDDRLPPLLDVLGLGKFFETVVLSVHAGATKPHRQIFDHALSAVKVPASEVLHVGDSYEEDVRGAREAGLQAILLDRKGYADESIQSLGDIV